MKHVALVSIVLALLVLMAAAPPESITLEGCGEKQSAVAFPHQAHIDLGTECTVCHHTSEGLTADSDMEVETCRSCHLNPAEEATPSCAEMSLKKNPFHAGCIDCHKTEAKGPTKCTECHPK